MECKVPEAVSAEIFRLAVQKFRNAPQRGGSRLLLEVFPLVKLLLGHTEALRQFRPRDASGLAEARYFFHRLQQVGAAAFLIHKERTAVVQHQTAARAGS